MTHLINRFQFEITSPDEEHAFDLRHNFPEIMQGQIIEVVEQVCTKHVKEDEWIQIPKLEIDLGRFTVNSFGSEFQHVFLKAFEQQLIQKLAQIPKSQKETSRQFSFLQLFKYFLETGTLPWWADETAIDMKEISRNVLFNQAEEMRAFFYKKKFTQHVWNRVALQLDDEAIVRIISFFDELKYADEKLNKSVTAITAKEEIHKVESEKIKIIIHNILARSSPLIFKNPYNEYVLTRIFEKHLHEMLLQSSISEKHLNEIFLQSSISPEVIRDNFSEIVAEQIHKRDEINFKSNEADLSADVNPIDETRVEAEQGKKFIVRQAGIVLLVPFLKPFFNELSLLEHSAWKNKEAQFKAIHLLKFLSAGISKVPEYMLILEKILCGMDINEPILLEVSLGENEIHEAELLLESVIQHWQVLKNTTINGLRETFLKRDGLLSVTERGWLLQVERKTLDVLLDNVPWGYSTISLPWNDYIINVEW